MIWAVVVTKNRPEDLRRCLAALDSQSRPPDQILVVDNAEPGESPACVSSGARLLAPGKNLGSAGGQHLGWRCAFEAGASAVWAMDDDCIPSQRALEILWAHHSRWPNAALNCLAWDPSTSTMGPLVRTLPHLPRRPSKKDVIFDRKDIRPSDLLDGIFWNWGHFFLGTLVPRCVFQEVGSVDTRFFIRGEDYDYLIRCLRRVRVGIVLDSIIHHPMKHQRSVFGFKEFIETRNHVFIDRKYFPGFLTSSPLMLARCLRDLLRYPRAAPWICLAYFHGILGFFENRPMKDPGKI